MDAQAPRRERLHRRCANCDFGGGKHYLNSRTLARLARNIDRPINTTNYPIDHQAETMALWVLHAHSLNAYAHSPRLHLKSPVLGCGKTNLASLLEDLTKPQSFMASSFTISAYVQDPFPGQTLTLELPDSMERVEGKLRQPVPLPDANGYTMVLWKARVLRPGDFHIRADQQFTNAGGCAGVKSGAVAQHQFANIDWMKPINVLFRPDA